VFKITGANNFTTGSGEKSPIEVDDIRKTAFFYTDGQASKIYARSYQRGRLRELREPLRRRVSVEQMRPVAGAVLFHNYILRNNRTRTTGSALDLLHGGAATNENCLFVGNIANLGVDVVGLLTGGEFHPENGSGAITGFAGSRAIVSRSTLTGNWSGVDDAGRGSTLRRLDFLEEHPRGRDFRTQALRDRH